MWRILLITIAITVGLGPAIEAHGRPKTDIIILENGDRITCEILQLARGKLTAKTDRLGTVEIEWNGVVGEPKAGTMGLGRPATGVWNAGPKPGSTTAT